jgi:hypothetical protein
MVLDEWTAPILQGLTQKRRRILIQPMVEMERRPLGPGITAIELGRGF